MQKWTLAGTTAVLALMMGQAAFAITPEEVWKKWADQAVQTGQTVTTESEAREGDTLVVTGAKFVSTQDGATATITMPKVALKDLGDGTVEMTLPEAAVVEIAGDEAVVVEFSAPTMTSIASGTVEETSFALNMPEGKISVVSIDGKTAADTGNDITFTVTNTTGSYMVAGDTTTSDITAEKMAVVVKVAEPGGAGKFDMTMNMAGLAGKGTMTMAADGTSMEDLPAALAAGMAMDFGYTIGTTDFAFDFADDTDTGSGKGVIAGGDFAIKMDATQMAYSAGYKGVDLSMSASSIPVPEVKLGLAELAFGVVMPVAPAEAPQDASMLVKLVDLTISDDIWGMIDPAANLPRDPITAILDLKATLTVMASLLDEEAMASGAPPALPNSIDLTQLQLKLLGAELNGVGSTTIDMMQMGPSGMPAMEGKFNFDATGVNALLDKIAAMGLVPEDQLMGARMMMGMFAAPGEGEDTLVSEVEFKDGGLFVNGMQLQ
jgi:hypothetical protein